MEIANEVIPVEVPTQFNNMQKSRFLKTSLRKYISGDFLYIDNDTIICDDISEIDNMESPLMGVPDFHCDLTEFPGNKSLSILSEKIGLHFDKHKYCFNGGVLYAKDHPISYDLFNCWHSEWIKNLKLGYSTDQQSLFAANEKCGFPIKKMDDAYNCQIIFNGLKYLYRAKIIHYFASGFEKSGNLEQPYLFQNKLHYQYLKENGTLDAECEKGFKSPKGAFVPNVQIVTSFQSEYNNTPFYSMSRNFYYNHSKLIKLMSKIKHILKK